MPAAQRVLHEDSFEPANIRSELSPHQVQQRPNGICIPEGAKSPKYSSKGLILNLPGQFQTRATLAR
jgi:hypothetical protein